MQKVWDGSNWVTQNALKVWTGSTWITNAKLKARTSTSWLPTAVSDTDISQVVKWSIEAPTPPPPPPPVTHIVPDLDLLTTTQMGAALTPLNFGYTIAGYETTSVLANDDKVVIDSQIPPAGNAMAEFNDVSVKLYNFVQPTTIVPNVGGLLKSAADSAIVAANLVVGSPLDTVETYDGTLVGKVVVGSQYPTAGTEWDQGTSVVYDYYIQKPYVTVPNLVNSDEVNIYTTLSALNLSVGTRTTEATANTALDGIIKSTFPVSGTQVQTNSSVNYTVYTNTLATVPSIVGLTQAQADTALQGAYLYSGTVSSIETTVVANEGKVASQATASGQTVGKFSNINFAVYVPNTTIAVPSLVGQTFANASSLITNAELVGNPTTTPTNTTSLHLTIKSQSPTAGSIVNVGSTVNVEIWVPYPSYTVPSIIGFTPSSGAIDSNFTWGSNSLASTSTQTTSDFGKVASQTPSAGTQVQAQAINYGIYVDGRPVVPSVLGQTQSSAQTYISNVGLNYSTTFQNQTFSGQATAGTVASQTPLGGSRLASGGTVSIVVWNAYVPVAVTRTGTVTVGDNTYSGGNYLLDWTWQAHYKNMQSAGTRVSTSGYANLTGNAGYWSATNGKEGMLFKLNPANVDSYIKSQITTNQPYTVTGITLKVAVGSLGNNGKTWNLDWAPFNGASAPTTYSDASMTNTQTWSGISNSGLRTIALNSGWRDYIWSYGYALAIAARTDAANSAVTYGQINGVHLLANISWTEYQ